MIDVITVRGTGNTPGPLNGMCGLVARKLNVTKFSLSDCNYPATIGEIGRMPGQRAYPLDVSVDLGVADLAWQVRETKNRVGLISYSLGGIVVARFLEKVQRGELLNANGTKLDVAFAVNIANPARAKGDSAVPAPGYERISAERLIEIDSLVDVLAWNRYRVDDETAEELWVDLATLLTRVKNLDDDERAYIDRELERRQP